MRSSILRMSLLSFSVFGSSGAFAAIGPNLEAGFDDTKPPWSLAGISDTLVPRGGAKVSEGRLELGSAGLATLASYVQPRSAFTIEARFKLASYAPMSTRWISDLVNTATWETTIPQGFTLRVGGGELYPVLPSTAYDDANGYGEGFRYFDRTSSASFSRCIGEFNIGTGGSYWKEVYTDVCVETGRWSYLVAVYDGAEMRIYLNGKDATDGWRTQGVNASPRLDETAMLHIGARTTGSYDSRHSDGSIDFVRIHDSALSAATIRKHYQEYAPEASDARCGRMPVIVSPAPGEWSHGKSRIQVRLVPTPGCPDEGVKTEWKIGDRVHVRISRSIDDPAPVEVVMDDSVGTFEEILPAGTSLEAGEVLLSSALDSSAETSAPQVAGRALASASLSFSSYRPIVVGATTGVGPRNSDRTRFVRADKGAWLVDGAERPVVLGLDGRIASWTSRKTESGWRLTPGARESGVRIVRSGDRSSAIVLP